MAAIMANAVYIGLRTDQSHGLLYRLWPQVLLAIATFTIFQDTQPFKDSKLFYCQIYFLGPNLCISRTFPPTADSSIRPVFENC